GQWPRPVPFCKLACFRTELADPLRGGKISHVHNQRVEAWSSLGLVDQSDGLGVRRVGSKPVNRLGGHGVKRAASAILAWENGRTRVSTCSRYCIGGFAGILGLLALEQFGRIDSEALH